MESICIRNAVPDFLSASQCICVPTLSSCFYGEIRLCGISIAAASLIRHRVDQDDFAQAYSLTCRLARKSLGETKTTLLLALTPQFARYHFYFYVSLDADRMRSQLPPAHVNVSRSAMPSGASASPLDVMFATPDLPSEYDSTHTPTQLAHAYLSPTQPYRPGASCRRTLGPVSSPEACVSVKSAIHFTAESLEFLDSIFHPCGGTYAWLI